MKTELRIRKHHVIPGADVFELWYDGRLIGTVVGAEGPGVRVISKYTLTPVDLRLPPPHCVEVKIAS